MAETNSNQRLFRQQAAILVAMFNTSETVNGSVLSQNGRFSVKTLKREIAEINLNFASANGFFIESITGVGYRLVIKDAVKYQAFKEQITAKYYRYEYFRNSQADMVHYMLRRFLTEINSLIKEKYKRHRYLLITVPFVFFSKTIIKPCCLKSLLIA